MKPAELSDDDLLARIRHVCAERQRLLAELVLLLVEVEERRLHLRTACPSVYAFCRQELGMSEAAAFRRSVAVQLVRRFPSVFPAIRRGDIHLSILVLLRDHLTADNVDALVAACAGMSTRAVEELLAKRAPRPDVPASLRAIPEQGCLGTGAGSSEGASAVGTGHEPARERPRVEPLSAERFELRVTISRALREKIQHARDLMRHANPNDDLERVLERAVDALVEKLEKKRLAKTERPREMARGSEPGHVAAAARRAVFERDGTQCTYVDARGKRCTCTTWLELDHIVPRADGGSDDVDNLRVRCRSHNRLWAEERFGKEQVAACIDLRRRNWNAAAAELAHRGLVNLGFKARDATRALDAVAKEHAGRTTPLTTEEMLRHALTVLT